MLRIISFAVALLAVTYLICGLSSIYLNTGFLATMAIATVFLGMAYIIIFLEKREKNKEKIGHKDDGNLSVYALSEAMQASDELDSEFHKLVSEILYCQAAETGKLLSLKEANGGNTPRKKLITSKDMDAAFVQAIKELNREEPKCASCDNPTTLLDKIVRLRKEYEKKYEEEKRKEHEIRKQTQTP